MQMNVIGWMVKYCPVPANKVKAEDAIAHSLLKWQGYRKSNLKEFGLSSAPLRPSAANCALCLLHYESEKAESCENCPIFAERGQACDNPLESEGCSPYWSFMSKGDPEPMIELLERCLKTQELI
jgi:hypothetical protein